MEAVHILVRVDASEHGALLLTRDPGWERELDEDAVDGWVGVERVDLVAETLVGDVVGQSNRVSVDAGAFGRSVLVADVDLARRILTREDHRESGYHAASAQCGGVLGHLAADLPRDLLAVDDAHWVVAPSR